MKTESAAVIQRLRDDEPFLMAVQIAVEDAIAALNASGDPESEADDSNG